MADATPDTLGADEKQAQLDDNKEDDQLRATIANVYTFVRSTEINKAISSFTFDHYIDEAKRSLKDDRILRSASDPSKGVGTRLSKITALEKLKTDFAAAYEKAKEKAETADADKDTEA